MLGFAAITPGIALQLAQQGYGPTAIGTFSALAYTVGPLVGGIAVEISPLHGAAWVFSILAALGLLIGRKFTFNATFP
jgi:hypothetical protein